MRPPRAFSPRQRLLEKASPSTRQGSHADTKAYKISRVISMSITTRYSLATYPGSARAWNGNNVLALLKQPCKGHLAGSSVILRSYGVNSLCDLENL